MTNIVRTYKASGPPEVSDTAIEISIDVNLLDGNIGTNLDWETRWRDLYESEARQIEQALYKSLPGGTYDALLIKMMDRKRSIFKVPLER